MAAAFLLATEMLQDFALPEAPQLTGSGEVRSYYWGGSMLPGLSQWAAEAGITLTDALIPGGVSKPAQTS